VVLVGRCAHVIVSGVNNPIFCGGGRGSAGRSDPVSKHQHVRRCDGHALG